MSRTNIMIKPCGFNYKGQTVEDVIDKDPQYIDWCVNNDILMLKKEQSYIYKKSWKKLS